MAEAGGFQEKQIFVICPTKRCFEQIFLPGELWLSALLYPDSSKALPYPHKKVVLSKADFQSSEI